MKPPGVKLNDTAGSANMARHEVDSGTDGLEGQSICLSPMGFECIEKQFVSLTRTRQALRGEPLPTGEI